MNFIFIACLLVSLSASCSVPSDCGNEKYYSCEEQLCIHKKVLPMMAEEVAWYIAYFFMITLASIGGGAGMGTCLILCTTGLKFGIKESIAYNLVSLAVSAMTRTVFKCRDRNDDGMLLINYSLSSFLLPFIIIGAYIGVYIALIIPDLLIIIVLILLVITMILLQIKSFIRNF